MKNARLFLAATLMAASSASAATLTWDITPGAVGEGDSTITGGTGTWNTTNGNWTADGGTNNVAWTQTSNTGTLAAVAGTGYGNTATFGGSAGTVTLGNDIGVNGITVSTSGYTFALDANNLFVRGNSNFNDAVITGTTGKLSLMGTSIGASTTPSVTYTMSNANTYAGGTIIGRDPAIANGGTQPGYNSGVAVISGSTVGSPGAITSGAFGTGTININSGGGIAANNTASANPTGYTIANAVTFAGVGNGTFKALLGNTTNNAKLTFSGAWDTTTGSVYVAARSTVEVSGNITGTGDLGLSASSATTGVLILSGTNNYSGKTTLETSGTLLVNGNNSAATGVLTAAAGSTLGGVGIIGASTSTISGKITGGTTTTIGTLSTGALTIGATGVYLAQINSATLTADKLAVTGALTLNATSTLTLNDLSLTTVTPGQKLTLASYDTISGTFNGVADGSILTLGSNQWQIAYNAAITANTITLTAVPEPSTYGMMGAGALATVALVRRRRKHAGIAE